MSMEPHNSCPACDAGIKTSVRHQIQVTNVQTKKKLIMTVADGTYNKMWELSGNARITNIEGGEGV